MLARGRRCLSVTSDSSDDDPPQRGRRLRSSTQAQSLNIWPSSGCSKKLVERQDTNIINSDHHKLFVQHREKQKPLISMTRESSNNQIKKSYNVEGTIERRPRSSSDKASGPSRTGNQQEGSLESLSPSDDKVVRSRSGKSRKRQSDLVSSSDSSDSGTPVEFNRKRKRAKSAISTVDSDSGDSSDCVLIGEVPRSGRLGDSSDCELIEEVSKNSRPDDSSDCELIGEVTRSVRPAVSRNDPTTSRFGRVRQQTANPFISRNNSHIAVQYPRHNWNNIRTRRSSGLQNIENFRSNHVIRPSRPFVSITTVDDTSSSSDSDYSLPVTGRGFIAAFLNENNSLLTSSISTTQPQIVPIEAVLLHKKTSSTKEGSCANTSESDEESEKCPICLVQFGPKKVGVPGSCIHRFCLVCIQEWAKINNICPVDRKRFNLIRVLSDEGDGVVCEIKVETPLERALGDDWWEVLELIDTVYDDAGSEENINFNSDCHVCQNTSDFEDMIMCECCHNVYHVNCLDPPPSSSPSLWLCPECYRSLP